MMMLGRLTYLLHPQRNFISRRLKKPSSMSFHFGTNEYAACFRKLPSPNTEVIRAMTLEYLDSFDPKAWYDDPMASLLKGEKLLGAAPVETKNALGVTNGNQIFSSPEQCEMLKDHIKSFKSPYTDLRDPIRKIERRLLTDYPGLLIGNQCIDFKKQDGITEIEEAVMANTVEQRLNDLLLSDEKEGKVTVNRQPIYVSCVSNFTNFLDLFRKTLRSLEVGVPCVVLGRSNTSQHSYRWAGLLVEMCKEHDIDQGMITFVCCDLPDIIDITQSCMDSTGNLYTTCSRELAASIKATYPKTVASTGGPNTLVATKVNKTVCDAIRMSATIESSGQCTALRHCVIPPDTSDENLEAIFDDVIEISDAPDAVDKSLFDAVFSGHAGSPPPGETSSYKHHSFVDAYIRFGDELPVANGINEYWRKVVVDFSKMDLVNDKHNLDKLAKWLNENQPISLAVNGPRKEAIDIALELFAKTGMVVNTVGSTDNPAMPPAMTCQARPQEGEIFGEFPPRAKLSQYTRFPVVVPSSNPSYDTTYTRDYLVSQEMRAYIPASARILLNTIQEKEVFGYCLVVIDYLRNAALLNPKQGTGKARTSLFGLQRPPLGSMTVVRCGSDTVWDDIAPLYMIFYSTTAREQIHLAIDPSNTEIIELCQAHDLPHTVGSEVPEMFSFNTFNVVDVEGFKKAFPMVGNFVSLYLPLGHIKSTMPQDEEFVLKARLSDKWLNTIF